MGKDVVGLESKVERLNLVEGLFTIDLLRQGKTELTIRLDLLIELTDDQLDRLLETLRIVNLEDRLPGRDREDGAIDRQSVLAAEGRGEILAQIDSLPGLESDQRIPRFRIGRSDRREEIVHNCHRFPDDKGRNERGGW